MKALILAAGLGTRLGQITESTPKVLAPIEGKPLLSYHLNQLKKYGIKEVLINTHYFPEQVEIFCQEHNLKDPDITINTAYEKKLLGSAGTLLAHKDFFAGEKEILIVYGDVLTDIDYSKLIAYHRDSGSLATIVCSQIENIEEKGMVVYDSNNRITLFKEKPKKEEIVSHYANAGIYVLETSLLEKLTPLAQKTGPLDFGHDVFPFMLQEQLPIFIYKLEEFLLDIGTPENYKIANEKINQLNI